MLRSKRTPAPGGCGERGKRGCLSHLGSSPHVAGGSVGRSVGCRALLHHPWNKGFRMGVTQVSCRCRPGPACPGREVRASGHWPWPMFGLLPRIPTLAHECPGRSGGMGVGSASACLGAWGPGWGTGSIDGGKVHRALPSRSLWVGRHHVLTTLVASGLGRRFWSRQLGRRAGQQLQSSPGRPLPAPRPVTFPVSASPQASSTCVLGE